MRNQPQFDILSPLYSNPPVWPGAEFVRGHNGWEPKEIPRAALEGLVGGDSMLADGNIIRRFVCVQRCMSVMGRLWFPCFHQLNVARTVRQARTINSMWRGMHFRAQWGLVPFDPFDALACALCRRRIKFLDESVPSDVRFSNMGTEWGGYHLHLLLESLLYPLSVLLWCLSLCSWGGAQFASSSAKKD